MDRVDGPSVMQALAMNQRGAGETIGFVPTMGALHDGHMALIEEARRRAELLVVSIFVNPKQFDKEADLDAYPRQLEADAARCENAGVDVLFTPSGAAMYPPGFQTTVQPGPLAERWEGEERPGHFAGMLTVVSKLFSIVQPHFAVFGEKDFQQLALVRRMVRDLSIPVEILPMPVLRELDGLALSSRNARLGEHREAATCLIRGLEAAQALTDQGERDTARLVSAALEQISEFKGFELDYAAVVDSATLEPLDILASRSRMLLAGRLGGVRLIDNGPLFAGS